MFALQMKIQAFSLEAWYKSWLKKHMQKEN